MKKRVFSLLLLVLFLCLMAHTVTALPDSFTASKDSLEPFKITARLPVGGVLTAPDRHREKPVAERITLSVLIGLLAFLLFLPKLRLCIARKRLHEDRRSAIKRYLSPHIYGSRFRKGAFSLIS